MSSTRRSTSNCSGRWRSRPSSAFGPLPSSSRAFRLEAMAVARLQHPNIVQLYEIGQVTGRPFYSMEYVAGGSLADRLRVSPPSPEESAELMRTLALAVHAAHQQTSSTAI